MTTRFGDVIRATSGDLYPIDAVSRLSVQPSEPYIEDDDMKWAVAVRCAFEYPITPHTLTKAEAEQVRDRLLPLLQQGGLIAVSVVVKDVLTVTRPPAEETSP